jgi:hypothetical protein
LIQLDWNQQRNGHYSNGDRSLHSVHGQIHAGPHSIPAHSDNGIDPNLLNGNNNDDTGAFVSAGTAGQQGFDVRTLGLSEQELKDIGLHPSLHQNGRQLPLDQYKINYDPNPIIIRKQIPAEIPTYKQQVIVRYRKKEFKHFFILYFIFIYLVRPPTPPSPGPLIIKEVREPQPAAAPPLIIRTRAPREKTPPPIIIREAPPHAPHVDTNPQYVTRVIRHTGSSYSSPLPPQQQHHHHHYHHEQQRQQQQQQQQQQHQQYQSFENGTVNYDQFNGIQNGNQFRNGTNHFAEPQETAWVTELVSSNGSTSAAPPHLLGILSNSIFFVIYILIISI